MVGGPCCCALRTTFHPQQRGGALQPGAEPFERGWRSGESTERLLKSDAQRKMYSHSKKPWTCCQWRKPFRQKTVSDSKQESSKRLLRLSFGSNHHHCRCSTSRLLRYFPPSPPWPAEASACWRAHLDREKDESRNKVHLARMLCDTEGGVAVGNFDTASRSSHGPRKTHSFQQKRARSGQLQCSIR